MVVSVQFHPCDTLSPEKAHRNSLDRYLGVPQSRLWRRDENIFALTAKKPSIHRPNCVTTILLCRIPSLQGFRTIGWSRWECWWWPKGNNSMNGLSFVKVSLWADCTFQSTYPNGQARDEYSSITAGTWMWFLEETAIPVNCWRHTGIKVGHFVDRLESTMASDTNCMQQSNSS
jgi:hypothetical protein